MKKYFKHFIIPYIIFGTIFITFTAMMIFKNMPEKYVRNNPLCMTTQRVFDNADLLTDEEEEKLENLIAKTEAECGADIVIVNLNESLEEFAHSVDPNAPIEDYVMIFADEFYEEKVYGFDEPYGDGVIFVDNRFHEADGYMYTWMGTTGRIEWEYSSRMIDDVLWETEQYLDIDTFTAYKVFIEEFKEDMTADKGMDFHLLGDSVFWAFVITGIFAFVTKHKKAKKTTSEKTFLGYQQMNDTRDVFIRKSMSSRVLETSSSSGSSRSGTSRSRSGGGGHHRSSSGRSHGGGGRRRR